jgi:purine-binding chemotaxis protein CheW
MTEKNIRNDYLTFQLGDVGYALRINKVQEILVYSEELADQDESDEYKDFSEVKITPVPKAPDFIKGITNVRGSIFPITSLELKFGKTEESEFTRIIVVRITVNGVETLLGIMASAVKDVIKIDDDQIEPPSEVGKQVDAEFIVGIANHENQLLIILDIDKVYSADELEEVQAETIENND